MASSPLASWSHQAAWGYPRRERSDRERSSGDQTGNEEFALTGDRRATRTHATIRVFGRDVKQDHWELETDDSTYRVDLEKKEGYRALSMKRVMADEYDKLSAVEKQRFQANAAALAGSLSKAFGAGSIAGAAEARGQETLAGQVCEVHKVGTFTVCTLLGAPTIPLHVAGEVMCLRTNKVASTAALNGTVPADRFALPADIKWKSADAMTEDGARQFVRHMASPGLTDSLAHAQQQLQVARDSARARQARAGDGGAVSPDSLTPQQRDQLCRTMRDGIQLHIQVTPPNPAGMVQQQVDAQVASADSLAKSAAKSAADTAVSKAKQNIFGKFTKPKIP